MNGGAGGRLNMAIPKNGDIDAFRVQLLTTIAQHDSAIETLGGRMTGVETGLHSLQKEMHTGFTAVASSISALGSQFDKSDAQPRLDLHKAISSVVALAVLFSMIVAGIIWITSSQFGAVIAEQKGYNAAMSTRIGKVETSVDKLADAVGQWKTRVVENGRK